MIHNGLWDEEFEPSRLSETASDLLFIGELRKLNGVDVLLNAMAQVSKQLSVSATVVGDGPDRAEFEALANQLGLADGVRFIGALNARSAFQLGHILVVPSRAESFPYIVIEAMAARKPIIASRVGGIPEVLEDDSLVAPDDAAALAAALADALDSPDRLAANAERSAARAAEQLDVRVMTKNILKFYDELLVG